MMPALTSGVPAWMVHGGPAPLATVVPPAKSSGGVAIALGVGALMVLVGVIVGVAWWSTQCDAGYHDSQGHCCRVDATWDEGRRACLATATPIITNAPAPSGLTAPIAGQPSMRPIPAPPAATEPTEASEPAATPASEAAPEPAAHPCLGVWNGRIVENTGAFGRLRVTITDVDGTCGGWREAWQNSGSNCEYRFTGCRFEDGVVRGAGVSTTPNCTGRVDATVRCRDGRMSFRESTNNGVVDTASLRRGDD